MRTLSEKLIAGGSACAAIIIIYLHLAYLSHTKFKETMVSQAQQQLLTIAKTTANRLEEFIDGLSRELKIIATEPAVQKEIRNRAKQTKLNVSPIKIFYAAHKGDVDALTTLDANGIMLYRHPFIDDRPGMDHSDKPSVAYVMREHKPYVSNWFYNNLGELATSVSEPVFYRNEFVGIVRWMISLNTISERFIRSSKVGKEGFAYISDDKGIILSHPDPGHVGEHIIVMGEKAFPDHDWSSLQNIAEKLTRGEEGVGTYECPICGKRLMAYAPVHMGNHVWSICVSISYAEISGPIYGYALHDIKMTLFVVALVLAGSFAFYRIEVRRAADLKKKNDELEREVFERKRAERALQKTLDELELRVEERTAELVEINEELRWEMDNRRRMEEQLMRADRLSSLGELSAGIAHEIRNPLSAISVYMDVLKAKTVLDEQQSGIVSRVSGSVERISEIIKRVLDFARPTKPTMATVDINRVIGDTLKLFSVTMRKHEVELNLDLSTNLPDLQADVVQVQQVISNLFLNALEATPKGNEIRVTTDLGRTTVEPSLPAIIVNVADKGEGIEPEKLRSIFNPFYTTKTQGTGLGLAMAWRVMENHKGAIHVESTPGEGTIFTLEFPLEEAHA